MKVELVLLCVLVLPLIAFFAGLLIGIKKKKKLEEKIVKLEEEMQWEQTVVLKLERELAEEDKKKAAVYNISSAQASKMQR